MTNAISFVDSGLFVVDSHLNLAQHKTFVTQSTIKRSKLDNTHTHRHTHWHALTCTNMQKSVTNFTKSKSIKFWEANLKRLIDGQIALGVQANWSRSNWVASEEATMCVCVKSVWGVCGRCAVDVCGCHLVKCSKHRTLRRFVCRNRTRSTQSPDRPG